MAQSSLRDHGIDQIKQHGGVVTVQRRVVVNAPGKFFGGLTPSEAAASYSVEAIEYKEKHSFARHPKAWGAAHTGPGIRFLSRSDAIDDPDHRGFWTTLALWNRWRHDTYKDDPEAELPYLDELPSARSTTTAAPDAKKQPPAIKQHFKLVHESTHTYGGAGKLAGTTDKAYWFCCLKPGCVNSANEQAIKQVGTGTGQLFVHLERCQPALCEKLRSSSKRGNGYTDAETNEEYVMLPSPPLLCVCSIASIASFALRRAYSCAFVCQRHSFARSLARKLFAATRLCTQDKRKMTSVPHSHFLPSGSRRIPFKTLCRIILDLLRCVSEGSAIFTRREQTTGYLNGHVALTNEPHCQLLRHASKS